MNQIKKMSSISFFCPAYNDEKNITKVISRADKMLKKYAKKYEMIVVEDGSPDKTYDVLKRLKNKYKNLRIIKHEKNMGYGAALRDGFNNSKYDIVLYTDGDFQYDPTEFEKLFDYINDFDVIIGYKAKRNDSKYREFQSKIFNKSLGFLFGTKYKDMNCSMKLFKKKILNKIDIECSSAFIDAELMIKSKKLNAKVKEVEVSHYPRLHGEAGGIKLKVILPTITDMFRFFGRRLIRK